MSYIRDKIYYIDAWRFLNDFASGQKIYTENLLLDWDFYVICLKGKIKVKNRSEEVWGISRP